MKANTSLGQHFMVDTDALHCIVDAAQLCPDDVVLEIGPGLGALTKCLKKTPAKVITVELDERFEADITGNILETIDDIDFSALVSNLPYHISEPLFVKLLQKQPRIISVCVGLQFAQKLVGSSIIGSVFRTVYDVSILKELTPHSFDPQPKVMSAIVVASRKDQESLYSDFYKYPKSKVKNYLKTKTTKQSAQEFINKLPFQLRDKRLYTLSTDEFMVLKDVLEQM